MIIGVDVRCLMEGRHSGVEEYATKIIRAMVKRAARDKFVLFYNSYKPVRLPEFGPAVALVPFHYPNKLFNLWQYVFGWPRWDELVEQAVGIKLDVIFSPSARLLPLAGTPLVVTAHDLSYELFPEFYSWRRRLWHKLMRPRKLLQGAAHVIAVSQATRDDVVRLYKINGAKVAVIYSGVGDGSERPSSSSRDMGQERNVRVEKTQRWPLDRGLGYPLGWRQMISSAKGVKKSGSDRSQWPDKFILYLGTLEPRKNIVSVVEAYTAIAGSVPHHLVIAGEKGWLGRQVQEAIARSGAREKIHKIGLVDEDEKKLLYEAADLFVYPSFYEGFGFPPLEALLAGTPVITSHNSSLPEVVGEFATMVNPYDVSELALVMKELLLDLPVVSQETQNEIKRRFAWDWSARQTLEILRQAANGREKMG